MKVRGILIAAGVALVLAGGARGEFVPGRVFVARAPGKVCNLQAEFGGDRIWEIDPATGEATLFVQIPEEMCGFLTGLAFTPDGSRLRASMWLRNEILEFDSERNFTVVLDSNDGILCPKGSNNLAYDAAGNFYVVNECTRTILRFPAEGGPPTVFADAADGVGAGGAIAFAADGDLYLAHFFFEYEVRRITPDGNASSFDTFGNIFPVHTVTADDSGNVYVVVETSGNLTSSLFRYQAGDPESKDVLAVLPIGGQNSLAMSPDQSMIYVNAFNTIGGGTSGRVLRIDVVDGNVTTLAEFGDGLLGVPTGMAVVPIPPRIPTITEWGMVVMVLLLITVGTILIQRHRGLIG